jgi:hypothetical protein
MYVIFLFFAIPLKERLINHCLRMVDKFVDPIVIETLTDHPEILRNFWYFTSLCNKIFPLIGVNAYFEVIENGFVSFLENFENLIRIHYYPPEKQEFKKVIESITMEKKDLQPFVWRIKVTQNPTDHSDLEMFTIISQYWEYFNATTNVKVDDDGKNILEIWYEDGEIYNAAMDVIISGIKARYTEYGLDPE